ncbi:perosamine synthetase [Trichococcus flocculiformis]|uniref:LegC family aminotransferase n=1 Tax=Trichococcus TaxID=82802 RepID=UPI0007A8584A|nr:MULTISPECIES: LegC family aminotransferase [Trichococcus]CZR09134.1 degt/dnrj/eryc1/strs aminotransferase [Trichococcus sp. ES5]SHG26020.1 perosamine synthetase [Trichococcus flocculiformis]
MTRAYIPLSVPNLKGNELEYVIDAVKTEWVSTGGSYINQFEEKIADFVGVNEAVAVQSGTAALHLSLMEAGVTYGEEVIAPTLTFIAAVNPIRYCGAEPVFMDCDDSLCMDPVKLEKFLREECSFQNGIVTNRLSGKRIRAIVIVHVFGNLADMAEILRIADEFQLKVIEDATEALGSVYTEGELTGMHAGTLAHYGAYSFNGNKIMTTGGGGMIVARDQNELHHMRYLSTQAKDNPTNFIHGDVGYNYRMTNLQGALGLGQVEQLDTFVTTKKVNYELYRDLLKDNKEVELLPFREGTAPNYWFYALFIKGNRDIQAIMDALQEKQIQTRPIWGLIHEQKPYQGTQAYEVEKAIHYAQHVINIPCSTNLTEEDVRYVVSCLNDLLAE